MPIADYIKAGIISLLRPTRHRPARSDRAFSSVCPGLACIPRVRVRERQVPGARVA